MADLSTTRKRQRRNSTLASLNDEITSEELFFPLVLHIVPEPLFETDTAINVEDGPCRTGDKETPDDLVDYENADDTGKSTSPPLTDFDRAITRIESLPSHLTQSMQLNLKSILTVIHTQLMPSPSLTNPLITRVASLDTSPEELVMIAETIDSGLSAFLARGGGGAHKSRKPAPPTPSSAEPISPSETRAKSSSSTRSTIVRTRCAERDHRSCLLTNRRGVVLVSHIIPFSVRDTSATDFWKFIALFRGEAATAALKNAALGAGNSTDTLRNVWCLATDVHEAFDDGRLTVIPQLDETQVPYNPAATSEVFFLPSRCFQLARLIYTVHRYHRVPSCRRRLVVLGRRIRPRPRPRHTRPGARNPCRLPYCGPSDITSASSAAVPTPCCLLPCDRDESRCWLGSRRVPGRRKRHQLAVRGGD